MAEFRDSIWIDSSPEVVFEYLTDAELLTTWMGQRAELEATPGGRFAVDIAGHPVRGKYLEVEPTSRVVVSWGFAGSDDLPPGASTVEFRLADDAGGTRVELTHSDLPATEVPGHADGWANFLPRLADAAVGIRVPDTWQPPPG